MRNPQVNVKNHNNKSMCFVHEFNELNQLDLVDRWQRILSAWILASMLSAIIQVAQLLVASGQHKDDAP